MIKSSGLTLIELLLSMILSILLLGGIFSVFLLSQKTADKQTQLINLQETMRTISEILSNEIKTAGYIGCAKLSNHFPIENDTDYLLTTNNIISSYQGNHGFTVRHASLKSATLVEDMSSASVLYVTDEQPLSEDEIVIISDCRAATIFQVKAVSKVANHIQRIISFTPFKNLYAKNARVAPLEINDYFAISNTLYKKDIHHKKIALAEHISEMNIKFSIKERGRLREIMAEDINDDGNIVGVSVSYLIQSKTGLIYAALRQR